MLIMKVDPYLANIGDWLITFVENYGIPKDRLSNDCSFLDIVSWFQPFQSSTKKNNQAELPMK